MKETKSLKSFYPYFWQETSVQSSLTDALGDQAQEVISKLVAGVDIKIEEYYAEDIISDLVSNDSVVVESLKGCGSYGEFPIEILKFGPVFWIQASEFDDIGYFSSIDDALDYAYYEFQAYFSDESDND